MKDFPVMQFKVYDVRTPDMTYFEAREFVKSLNCFQSVPWAMVAPHAEQAEYNHSQTLEVLARRGGLGPCELVAVLEDRDWHRMPMLEANDKLKSYIEFYEEENLVNIIKYTGKRHHFRDCFITAFECGRQSNVEHVARHSPTGLNWGYGGSGPADTALSILTDYFKRTSRNPLEVEPLYQDFKFAFVSKFGETWELTSDSIEQWLAKKSG